MTKKTVNIFFIILGIIITSISIQKLLFIPLLIGLIATVQGIWGFIKMIRINLAFNLFFLAHATIYPQKQYNIDSLTKIEWHLQINRR